MSDQPTQSGNPESPFKDGDASFGSFYPKHYVLAVYPDDAAAGRAADALRAAGFAPDDLVEVSGGDVLAHEQTAHAHEGVLARLGAQWSRLYTDASAGATQLIDLARQGAGFVLAYAPDDAASGRAADVLRPEDPEVLRYYGTFTVTDLR